MVEVKQYSVCNENVIKMSAIWTIAALWIQFYGLYTCEMLNTVFNIVNYTMYCITESNENYLCIDDDFLGCEQKGIQKSINMQMALYCFRSKWITAHYRRFSIGGSDEAKTCLDKSSSTTTTTTKNTPTDSKVKADIQRCLARLALSTLFGDSISALANNIFDW